MATSALDTTLVGLARKGERAGVTAIQPDWSRPTKAPIWLPRRAMVWAISQFYHGEVATAALCARLADRIDSPATRRFLATQIADERRHADFYRCYLERLEAMAAVCPALSEAYAAAESWTGPPEAQVLAVHVILEGESVHLQRTVERWMPCPLFGDISRVVAVDEARHQAFGRFYLRDALPKLAFGERLEIFRWLERLWTEAVTALATRLAPPGFFSPRNSRAAWMRTAFARHCAELERLGLFAPRERPLFAAVSELMS